MIELYDLVEWLKRNLSITEEITIAIIVRDRNKKGNLRGYTSKKEIIQVIIYLDYDMTLSLLHEVCIHELIHVSQIIRGYLDLTTSTTTPLWHGRDYSEYHYEMLPWELEAHKYSKELLDLYNKGEDLSPNKREEMIKHADKIYEQIEYDKELYERTQLKLPKGIILKPFNPNIKDYNNGKQ